MDLMFTAGNRFYMTHKYDKRGRTYSQGYHINPQGNDWNKAVIEFADKEVINVA
jgi:DNA-directed RNA polymerase